VGSHIAKQLTQKGYELFCSIRKNSDTQFLKTLNTNLFEVNWNDKHQLIDIVGKVDHIIHCAAITTALSESQYLDGNVLPTVALLEAAKTKGNIKRFIFISTQAVTGPSDGEKPLSEDSDCHPISDYAKTKLIAEHEVIKYQQDFPVTILRPCSIYGAASTEFQPLFKLVKSHLTVVIGDGRNKVNMISVTDFVDAVLRCLEVDHPTGSVYFVTDGQEYDWNTIFRTAKEVYGKWTLRLRIPFFIASFIGWINDNIAKITKKPPLLNSQKVQEMKCRYLLCDSTKIQRELKFHTFRTLREGFQEALKWYQKSNWL